MFVYGNYVLRLSNARNYRRILQKSLADYAGLYQFNELKKKALRSEKNCTKISLLMLCWKQNLLALHWTTLYLKGDVQNGIR